MADMAENKQRFLDIFQRDVTREGADKLLEFLDSKGSDFYTAPASARFHGSYEGGLLQHSLNVYDCLVDYLARGRVRDVYGMDYTPESVAIAALLHDLCKINCYRSGFRNMKDDKGQWQKVPTFEFDDKLPYGHGEKSVYIITGYMRLTREEAFAIRYHMGFSGPEDSRTVGKALEQFPLACALFVADMEASYFVEGTPGKNS